MKKWSALSRVPLTPRHPNEPFPFRCPFGATLYGKAAHQSVPHHASGLGPLFPCNNREALLSPEEQPPHRNPNVSPILIKKRPGPFLLDQAAFLLFSVRQRTAAEVLPSSPHFSPQHSGRFNRRRNSCRTASPPVESLRKGGGRGGNAFFKRGFLPRFHCSTSLPHATCPAPTRRRQTIYS